MPVEAQTELDKVEAWRLQRLLEAGWAPHRAELLAKRPEVDIRQAVRMIQDGCDQKLALRILL